MPLPESVKTPHNAEILFAKELVEATEKLNDLLDMAFTMSIDVNVAVEEFEYTNRGTKCKLVLTASRKIL